MTRYARWGWALVGILLCAVIVSAGCSRRGGVPADGRLDDGSLRPSVSTLSSEAVSYARELGGRPHCGETLYLVVITRDTSEGVLWGRLRQATPYFGDVANYFVVLASESLPPLAPGDLILAEAYVGSEDAEENLSWWEGRVSADWYRPFVQKVTVETDSPIPVVGVDVGPPD